jgi:hypothetical protein
MKRLVQAINRLYSAGKRNPARTPEQVLATARSYMTQLGGALEDPVYVNVSPEGSEKRLVWTLRDRGQQRGGNIHLRIDDETGEVIEYNVPGASRTAP